MLNIVVCIKQVPDPLSVEIDPLSGIINTRRLAYIINPPDLEAVELALRWRESFGGRVQVLSVGPERAEQALRACLAMGVDSVRRVWGARLAGMAPSQTARILANLIQPLNVDLVLCGNRSSDNGSAQVPVMLAEWLNLAQATRVVSTKWEPEFDEAKILEVERKLERGRREKVRIRLPALLALESGQVEPRYPTLPAYMAAQKAVIQVVEPGRDDSGGTQVRLVEIQPPRPRPRQIFIPDPDLPAAARIQAILSGGVEGHTKKGSPLEGSPEVQAARILAFLEQQGFIGSKVESRKSE